MLLYAVCVIASLLFVFSLRKHKKILSALIAIETVTLISMLAVAYLSTAGNEDIYIFILARAITSKVSIFGISISSLMVIQAVAVLFAWLLLAYGMYRIVSKVCKKCAEFVRTYPEKKAVFDTRCYPVRKVFRLYCRMNN